MEENLEMYFDSRESKTQELSFTFLKGLEERRKHKLDTRSCILRREDGKYTNLALMLSDECPWTCEIRHDDTLYAVVTGSMMKQLDAIMKSVLSIRRELYTIDGKCAKIPAALSEVILNAITHRDYECDRPTIVDIGQDWIEVLSPGSMIRQGLSYSSRTRNPMLAEAFAQMGFKIPEVIGMKGVVGSYRSC